jgi:hypothetical protein
MRIVPVLIGVTVVIPTVSQRGIPSSQTRGRECLDRASDGAGPAEEDHGIGISLTTEEQPMSQKHSIDDPHERRPFTAHGHMDVVTLGDFTLGRGVFEPGWRWSEDVKPIAGTDSCQVHHTGLCLSGRMTIKPDDGEELSIGPGDVIDLAPGHDAWTVGDEPCVLIDTGVAAYARPS